MEWLRAPVLINTRSEPVKNKEEMEGLLTDLKNIASKEYRLPSLAKDPELLAKLRKEL